MPAAAAAATPVTLGAIISRFSFILGRESNMLRVRALSIKFKSVAPKNSLTLSCAERLHKVVNFGRLSGNRGKWKSQLGRIWNACRRSPAACCDCERCDVNVFCRLKWEIAQVGFYGPVNRTDLLSFPRSVAAFARQSHFFTCVFCNPQGAITVSRDVLVTQD